MRSTRSWTKPAIIVLAAVVLLGGAAFMLFGVGAELSERRDVRITIVAPDVHPDVVDGIRVGDNVYTDPAAMHVGFIDEVAVAPMEEAVPDSSGVLRVSEDPLAREVTMVLATQGRESAEIIAIGSQVVQVGMQFTVVSKTYQLRGLITGIDVR